MKITADTNVLLRAITGDDDRQSPLAQAALADADVVVLTLPALCEVVWVLAGGYRATKREIAQSIRLLVDGANAVVDQPAVDAGLALLDAGGDFADGVIAHLGRWMGGETFVSFDKQAIKLLAARGEPTLLLKA